MTVSRTVSYCWSLGTSRAALPTGGDYQVTDYDLFVCLLH